MKRLFAFFLVALLIFSGCAAKPQLTVIETAAPTEQTPQIPDPDAIPFESRFEKETVIRLTDGDMEISGPNSQSVFLSHDIIYYEDKDFYESGNPYGEGEDSQKHTAQQAQSHCVVNITAPGTYRLTGKLSAGQIRVDLGKDAYDDPGAVVELILQDADITCTVAPAILFLNVYECDGAWSADTASATVDTAAAGANLILEGENRVSGSHVARIYKDAEDEKKLWKQDGAIYSYMSMNVFGPGALELHADNEGLDTELHLTINGGSLRILADNDGINTNEDNVSVTTINGGNICIIAGLGVEGDGIDSNGYLVINGGTVIASANPAGDAGLDSNLGSFVNGGTVLALGAAMDWAESDSAQVTVNLQFAQQQNSASAIEITKEDGTPIFSCDPADDALFGAYARQFMGAIISSASFKQGETYLVSVDGKQMQYTATDVTMGGPGGFGGMGGQRPDRGQFPEGEIPTMPEGFEGQMPEGFEGQPPEGFEGQMPGGHPGDRGNASTEFAEGSHLFYMQDMVNFFSGLRAAQS